MVQPNEFTYETKKLLWKNMSITMRSELRTSFENCLIDSTMPHNLDCVVISAIRRAQEACQTPYLVVIAKYDEGFHHWEFSKNRVVVKTREDFWPTESDPRDKKYNVSGSSQELISQFLTFTFGRPGTKIRWLELNGLLDIEVTNTLFVKTLVFGPGQGNDSDLTFLNKIQKPLPSLHIVCECFLTKLANFDLIQTAKEVYLNYGVTCHKMLLMFKSSVIVVNHRYTNSELIHNSDLFDWINAYAQQDRPIGHYFQMSADLITAELIIDILINHHKEIGWENKCIKNRKCATLLRNHVEVTAFIKIVGVEYDVELVVESMDLGTAKNREELRGPLHLSNKEIDTILKYMDFHKKFETEFFFITTFFINDLFVDCESLDFPTFTVDGIPVTEDNVLTIFDKSSTVRHLHIKGVWFPDILFFQPVTVLNLTLETAETYPADFYNYLAAPEHTVGTLKVKNLKVLEYANEIINSYNLEIEDEEMEDEEPLSSCMPCSIM